MKISEIGKATRMTRLIKPYTLFDRVYEVQIYDTDLIYSSEDIFRIGTPVAIPKVSMEFKTLKSAKNYIINSNTEIGKVTLIRKSLVSYCGHFFINGFFIDGPQDTHKGWVSDLRYI